MISRAASFLAGVLVALALAAPTALAAEPENCEAEPRPACFRIESVAASLSTEQAGAHPDLTLDAAIERNRSSEPNVFGLKDSYAATRNIRFELPPGLIGDPNALGAGNQCAASQLIAFQEVDGGCPAGSQVGLSTITAYDLTQKFVEPVYMMQPPGGGVVARLGVLAGIFPTFIDIRVRSQSDYGISAEVENAPAAARLIELDTTLWGVPAAEGHDTERCTAAEAFLGCVESPKRSPSGNPLPFFTNPTRCGVPLEVGVDASSWLEAGLDPAKEARTTLGEISGCDRLPFGPSLEVEPTSHRALSPTGANLTIKLPASKGVEVLEPSQMREMKIRFPRGLAINTGASDGLDTCSPAQVGIGTSEASHCPDGAKLASTEFDIPVLERNVKGAIYLRQPVPGDPFRIWIVADDLGLHVKLPGELHIHPTTGQVESITLDPTAEAEGLLSTGGIPQAPLREVKLDLKSGFRAPLLTPPACGEYRTESEIAPWSGGPTLSKLTEPFKIDEGCGTGAFGPKLSAGSTDAQGGAFSPFVFSISREDREQNIEGLSLALPRGLTASFAGIAHCEGAAAETGACPAASRIGRVVAAVGAGPAPLWVPQPGARPTAVYLGGPYKGAPTSIVAVVPKQAGPFDFGDEVVRTAIYVDPDTARATARTDPLPQLLPGVGIPLYYRTISVELERRDFALNPTSCARKQTEAVLTSPQGTSAQATASYAVVDCARLRFRPKLALRLSGAIHRGGTPGLAAVVRMSARGANIAATSVTLPPSELVENEHFDNVCTRVDFAAHRCPSGSVYGHATAITPLFDFPLEGPVYLRTNPKSRSGLPDLVAALSGPASMPIEVDLDGEVDSVKGQLRTRFEAVPDAPVTKFTLRMLGGKKSLLTNTENLCKAPQRAIARFKAQNGRKVTLHPKVAVSCRHGARSAASD